MDMVNSSGLMEEFTKVSGRKETGLKEYLCLHLEILDKSKISNFNDVFLFAIF